MISISLCMIVKNEESCLCNCLESVKDLVDEMIIVDTGSTDKTVDIIKLYAGNAYSFSWINDFSAARNYAFSKATKDYILWLDADDVILPDDQRRLDKLKKNLPPSINAVRMIYDITFNKKGECILSVPRNKLIKNHQGFYWRYFVHEELVVWGESFSSDVHITHTSDHGHYSRYLSNYEQRLADGYELLPHEKYFYGGELFLSKNYEKCIEVLEDFLKTPSNIPFEQKRAKEFLITCYEHMHQPDRAVPLILDALQQRLPTAKECSILGSFFYNQKKYKDAAFWYQLIADPSHISLNAPVSDIVSSNVQLCVCYYALGEIEDAVKANNTALSLDPTNSSAIYNKNFFNKKIL